MYSKTPFSATRAETFRFNYQGPQAHENTMLITAANDETAVFYDPVEPTTTLALEHTVPANALQNGKQYEARVRVKPKEGQWSEYSDPIKFWCFGDPLFYFMYEGQRAGSTVSVHNSSVTFNIYYFQTQGEGLKSFRVDLYGSDGRLILEGQEKYNTGNNRYDLSNLTTTIRGLEDNGRYMIQAVGETDHGMVIKSDKIILNVEYDHPAAFSLIDVENLAESATIRVHSNLEMLEGWCTQEPPRYIDNSRIDLTAYGATVYFDKGFSLAGDFTIHLLGQNFHPYQSIFRMQNGDNAIELFYMRGWYDAAMREQAYFMLKVYNQVTNYVLCSPYINVPYYDDKIHLWIRRKGAIYDLDCCVAESGSHIITKPNEFDVQFRNFQEWNAVIVEGYQNEPEERLEF